MSSTECLEVAPTLELRVVRGPRGEEMVVPEGWELLPPGDAALTRRVKAAGPSWQVIERRGRKKLSRGLWAPGEHISSARAALEIERSDPSYARKLAASRARRTREEELYALEFANAVLGFLRFAPVWHPLAKRLAVIVAEHATPVGSGTVARTERIPIEERAEAAVIAWLRHQTTAYDDMKIPRVKGMRREVRRMLAERSRELLGRHRTDERHEEEGCALCKAAARPIDAVSGSVRREPSA